MIGVDIDYEVLGADNGMMMVTASGTGSRCGLEIHSFCLQNKEFHGDIAKSLDKYPQKQ